MWIRLRACRRYPLSAPGGILVSDRRAIPRRSRRNSPSVQHRSRPSRVIALEVSCL
jgi:hypothetical protein